MTWYTVGQRRDQVAVLVRAGRCAVQQDHRGCGGRAGLAIEDPATGDLGEAMMRDHF
jgi:ferritin-like protein